MSLNNTVSLPATGAKVSTSCGDEILFSPETPRAFYKGKWFYFCLPSCLRAFDNDPESWLSGSVPHMREHSFRRE